MSGGGSLLNQKLSLTYVGVEQLVACQPHKLKVAGSSPAPEPNRSLNSFSVFRCVVSFRCVVACGFRLKIEPGLYRSGGAMVAHLAHNQKTRFESYDCNHLDAHSNLFF